MTDDEATVHMEDAISSPPRSQGKLRGCNLLFSEDNDTGSVFSHVPTSPSDRKISLSPSTMMDSADQKTPKSRRLFDDEPEESLQDLLQQFSPQHPGCKARRYTLKPLDLNHTEMNTSTASADTIASADTSTEPQRPPTHPEGGRKRGSPGRRRLEVPKTPYRGDTTHNASNMMHTSPHMSPNSFLTMDGRFVQSRNPFSSPMMTDEDNLTPRGGAATAAMPTARSPAPPFPVSFPTDAEDDHRQYARLPPRSRAGTILSSPLKNGGFPDQRFSFTGSPIAELPQLKAPPQQRTAQEYYYNSSAMETELASAGSLHKVRRLSRQDDVVAATGQHLRNSMNPYPRFGRPPLAVETSASSKRSSWDTQEDISPTDVANFPLAPPTPVKSRREPPPPPYARIRNEPSTPMRPSRHSHAPTSATEAVSRFTSDFDVIGELGKGSFGQVYKVLSRFDGCMYAIKAGHRPAKGRADRDRMLKEVYALAALSDQADTAAFHIVRYHQAWMEEDRLYIQTELCTGTLSDEIARSGRPTELRRYKLMREMLLALEFIHRNNMVHLDIKPDNVFLKNDQFKLGDFGLVSQSSAAQDVEEGDSRYMSMELLQGDRSDLTKSDIFSLGITLYEICRYGGSQGLPMNGDEWQNLRAGQLETSLPETGPEMYILIRRMMDPIPTLRPAASDLLKHPQLLSEEQKALNKERSKVARANMQLAARQFDRPPTRKRLVRANTWNGNLSIL